MPRAKPTYAKAAALLKTPPGHRQRVWAGERLLKHVFNRLKDGEISSAQARQVADFIVAETNSNRAMPANFTRLRAKFPFLKSQIPVLILPVRAVFKRAKMPATLERYKSRQKIYREMDIYIDRALQTTLTKFQQRTLKLNSKNWFQQWFANHKNSNPPRELIKEFIDDFSIFIQKNPQATPSLAGNFVTEFERQLTSKRRKPARKRPPQ